MNPIAEEILMHYGMPRRSGRYPWGSGEDPYQHSIDFLGRIEELKKKGWSETPENIMKEFGLTTGQYRNWKAIGKNERRALQVATAKAKLADNKGNVSQVAREMGLNESTVRSLLDNNADARMREAKGAADHIKKLIEEKGMIDVTSDVHRDLNISKERLDQALYALEYEGYPVYMGRFEQPTNRGQWTTQTVICPKGTPYKDIYQLDQIHALNEDNYISRDGGTTFEKKFNYPESMDSSRLKIRYNEEGGIEKDGIIELRRGVDDLSLGESRYAQVRILVDKTHYLKGMAVYSDDMPDGVDVIFNTNKKQGTPMTDVLKEIKKDPDNPFGSTIKDADKGGQYWYDAKTGLRCKASDPNAKLGLINKRADEGDWSEWKDALPSQFLGKQSLSLVKKQLDLAKVDKLEEFDDIMAINNPTIKKHYLEKFASECDSAAVHLQAAALPGQKHRVIIPINSLKDTEVYAPQYEDGTQLALIRYPHGGTFEIPILKVNNKNAAARKLLGRDIEDAVGINSRVAERLSGADFDGDTVMCIPTHDAGGKVRITNKNPLKGLEGFDPKVEYGPETYKGRTVRLLEKSDMEMGKISNLITDMTLAGASDDELARAVRHSMVVIDAVKHKLDYKQSEVDNNIAALKKDYQAKVGEDGVVRYGGASTILSRAKSPVNVDKRRGNPNVNIEGKPWYDPTKPEGALLYKTASPQDLYYEKVKVNKKTGEVTTITKTRTQQSSRMAEADDAYELVSSSRHPVELAYADYANNMKALANRARKEMVVTGNLKTSAAAKEVYKAEIASLDEKLHTALLNKSRERDASRKANAEVAAKLKSGEIQKDDIKKASQQALTKYRDVVGSVARKDRSIKITDREWEAIQAGAITENTLKSILNNADVDELRQRATPRSTTNLSTAKVNKIKAMSGSNYTLEQIATSLGVSVSTVSKYLKKGAN